MSYHRPRVFRSTHGCCICKAKSSSSRFTDSGKYNDTFYSCFNLKETREGDICNACVLLVKRFRMLPEKSKKNWSHVVDARAGPGVKSFVRKPRRPPDITPKKKHVYRRRHKRKAAEVAPIIEHDESPPPPRLRRRRVESPFRHTDSPLSMLSDSNTRDDWGEANGGEASSRAGTPESRSVGSPALRAMSASPAPLFSAPVRGARSRKRLILPEKISQASREPVCGFFDSFLWKREKTCCGSIFRGPFGEVVIDTRYHRPCAQHSTNSNPSNSHVATPLAGKSAIDNTHVIEKLAGTAAGNSSSPVNILSDEQTSSAIDFNRSNSNQFSDRLSSTSPTSVMTNQSSTSSAVGSSASTVSGATSFESLIESELKAFGLESENSHEDDEETIDFYCNEKLDEMKGVGAPPANISHEDIDEGFFDKPARNDKIRLSCESPSQLSL